MTIHQLRPWSQVVRLDHDVESGNTAVAAYAIDLGALVAGDPRIPAIYRRPRDFFAATYLTSGMRRLLGDVLDGLAGGTGDRVLQLRSPFGGGKSHTLAALYHAAHDRSALDVAQVGNLRHDEAVRVAVFDGEKFDVLGREVNGQSTKTMWGALAAQLGCYDIVAYHDAGRVAPGGDVIARMLADAPTLILLDEVLKYLERVLGEPVGDSTLGRQTQDFIQSLSTEVARSTRTVLVYSLQASTREAYGNAALLGLLDHLTSRVDAKREPVVGDEILPVLRRRLLSGPVPSEPSAAVAEEYATQVTHMRRANASDEVAQRTAEDDRLALRDRFAAAYPFHPALIDIMRERWASLPDFQRTRGALRFLAICLHVLKRENRAGPLLGPGDIPIDDADVAQAFFTEVGQREAFKAVLQRDFHGPNARIARIDERLAREQPHLSGVQPARRLATAILAYSFGGLSRTDEQGGDPIATGVTENELLDTAVAPDLDGLTARAVLKELREQCLYLHYDGAHYVFKTTPNVTQVLEDQAAHIEPREIEQEILEELNRRLSGRANAIVWPRGSQAIPDREPRFLLAYLPLDFAIKGDATQEAEALDLLTRHGDLPRRFRNGLGLTAPERNQVEPLRRAVRYLKAIKLVRDRRAQLNLTSAQLEQLRERERTEDAAKESSLRTLYQSIWLPVMAGSEVGIEKVTVSGRPLQALTIHERLHELLTIVSPPRLFSSVTPDKIIQLMALDGSGGPAVGVDQVIATFYEVLGSPRLESEAVVRRAVARGVRERAFGFVGRIGVDEIHRVREQAGYLVEARLVRIGVELPEDEIDPAAAFIVMPGAIASEAPPLPPIGTGGSPQTPPITPPPGTGGITIGVTMPPGGGTGASRPTAIRLPLRMTRQQLYASFQAIGNLAQEAGSIRMTVEAEKADGFDPAWLQNAVVEPLEEADVVVGV
jgi:hypothetical protein